MQNDLNVIKINFNAFMLYYIIYMLKFLKFADYIIEFKNTKNLMFLFVEILSINID